jgi:hypothetical protein
VRALLALALADRDADRVRRNHAEAIAELQGTPGAGARVIEGVELADGVETPVPHGLPRAPRWVQASAPRGPASAGYLEEVRGGTDRRRAITLRAIGFGATITVDVLVIP